MIPSNTIKCIPLARNTFLKCFLNVLLVPNVERKSHNQKTILGNVNRERVRANQAAKTVRVHPVQMKRAVQAAAVIRSNDLRCSVDESSLNAGQHSYNFLKVETSVANMASD